MSEDRDVVVITGGGSGIGRAAAVAFARRGAEVVITGRTESKLEETKKLADSAGDRITVLCSDISRAEDTKRLFSGVADRFGRLDVVFAHAGINGVWAPLEDLEPEEWQKTVSINLNGTFHTVKYAVPLLKASRAGRRQGSIVMTSSINGVTKFSDIGSSAYSATKAGLLAFMKLIAVELAPSGIRVNAICPGSIDTEIEQHTEQRNTKANEEVAEYKHGGIPLTGGRAGTAAQVARTVLFLASPEADHITGTTLVIDGGQSLIQ